MTHLLSILWIPAAATVLVVAAASPTPPPLAPTPSTIGGPDAAALAAVATLPAVGAVAAASPPPRDPIAAAGTTQFPDGSRLPALNGVAEDLRMPWPGGGPFSPVVDRIEHAGTQWYRHADGSLSTTLICREQPSGQPVAVPVCYRPEAVVTSRQRAAGR
jgi:hypothetical protein